MTNDAKLGLVLGVAIVLVIGLVFFRSEPSVARNPSAPARTSSAHFSPLPAAQVTSPR